MLSSIRNLVKYLSINTQQVRHISCTSQLFVSKKLVIHEFGDPLKVVKLVEEQEITVKDEKKVLVKMMVASINHADINTIQGKYPVKPELPGVPGAEGVGVVERVGPGVTSVKPGDLVIPDIENFGTWRTHVVVDENSVFKVPTDTPLPELCGIASNTSSAYRMLKDFVTLNPGDCIVQNGGNSAVGQNVIQLCKIWGLKSINIIRDRPDFKDMAEYLTSLGATYVLTEEELRTTTIVKDNPSLAPKLALNCVGGPSCKELVRVLAPKGVMVTYGGMSRLPVTIPTSYFIFKDIRLTGFWMTRWAKENRRSKEHIDMLHDLLKYIKEGKLKAPKFKMVPYSDYHKALNQYMSSKAANTKYILDFRG